MMTWLRCAVVWLLAALSWSAVAASSPQQVVQGTLDQLLIELNGKREVFRKNPELFYQSLDRILSPVVDFDSFSRGVMTVRYSQSATPAQMSAFQTSFKRSLMQFYGNALLEYQNQEIRMLPSVAENEPGRATVNMEIVGKGGVVYPLNYSMVDDNGVWKVRNVIVNGINIGKVFRDQFAESMRANGNSLDRVIATWGETVAKTKTTAEAAR